MYSSEQAFAATVNSCAVGELCSCTSVHFLIHPDEIDLQSLRKDGCVHPFYPTPVAAYGDIENQVERTVIGPHPPVTIPRSVREVRRIVDVGGQLLSSHSST